MIRFCFLAVLLCGWTFCLPPPPPPYSIYEKESECPLGLNCYKDLDEGIAAAQLENKPIMLDYHVASHEGTVCIGKLSESDNIIFRSKDEYTSPIVNIAKSGSDYVCETENSVFALLATEDYMDYYEAEGGSAYIQVRPFGDLLLEGRYQFDQTSWLSALKPSLLRTSTNSGWSRMGSL